MREKPHQSSLLAFLFLLASPFFFGYFIVLHFSWQAGITGVRVFNKPWSHGKIRRGPIARLVVSLCCLFLVSIRASPHVSATGRYVRVDQILPIYTLIETKNRSGREGNEKMLLALSGQCFFFFFPFLSFFSFLSCFNGRSWRLSTRTRYPPYQASGHQDQRGLQRRRAPGEEEFRRVRKVNVGN